MKTEIKMEMKMISNILKLSIDWFVDLTLRNSLMQSHHWSKRIVGERGGSGTRRGNFVASVSIKSFPDNCAASDIAAGGRGFTLQYEGTPQHYEDTAHLNNGIPPNTEGTPHQYNSSPPNIMIHHVTKWYTPTILWDCCVVGIAAGYHQMVAACHL